MGRGRSSLAPGQHVTMRSSKRAPSRPTRSCAATLSLITDSRSRTNVARSSMLSTSARQWKCANEQDPIAAAPSQRGGRCLTGQRGAILHGYAVGPYVVAQFFEHARGSEAEFLQAIAMRPALERGGALLVAFHGEQRRFDIESEEAVDARHCAPPVAVHVFVVNVNHPFARNVVARGAHPLNL